MDGVFIYEFLFRGGPTSSPDDDTWHLILAREVTDLDGNKRIEQSRALTPKEAADLGFPLSRINREINEAALYAVKEARDERDALRETLGESGRAQPTRSLLNKLSLGILDKPK